MAMNKKEQAIVEDLKVRTALRFTDTVELDVEIPDYNEPNTKGFLMNSYALRVTPACSSSVGHSSTSNDRTTSQKGIRLYSTKMLALKAMRNELEYRLAKELRRIDIMIEKELEE